MFIGKIQAAALAATTSICMAFGAGAAEAQTILRMNNWLPAGHLQLVNILLPWAEEVEKVTEGRVKIELTDASLGAPPRQYDLAVDGIADVTVGVLGYTPGRFNLAGVAELPFVGETAEELSVALWRTHKEYFEAADEYKGVVMLGIYANGTGHIMTGEAAGPVTSLENYVGKKFRVGGGLVQQVNTLLGGVNIAVPAGETYEVLSQGIADGTLLPYEAVPSFKLESLIKYSTKVPGGLYSSVWFVAANPDSFAKLSPEDQEKVLSVSGEHLARLAGIAQDQADAESRAKMEAAGTQFLVADDAFVADLKEKLASMEASWIETADKTGIDGRAALEYFRAQVAELKK
ncbi:TRAP transporter substrate-binding protein [Aquamicrobium zhengzhouense]|uniref:TRAP transporter substrate-binding protein n=1 Tax=Aquamicrobium zhengzhouense TaxID=2781738 RepID=A0ABS0SIP1_9HYPH|nr:TRAP transporter substrate-binding protein [Aquamicrobium zhengzhouense]MBI1622427.1 TRAP transporter substrate-binding protein [Aquamicrobium zhengzhouense]